MFGHKAFLRVFKGLVLLWVLGICPVFGAGWKTLPGHVPEISKKLVATGRLPATHELRLAIGVPLRDAAGLDVFISQVSDPASPQYRKYLTPEDFTARFGPTAQDYQEVIDFARTNGLTITATHSNRLVLDVSGSVASIEKAFQVHLQTFKHPTEAREFFAPDAEPTVDAALPVADVSGLNNFKLPHPKSLRMNSASLGAQLKAGSAPGAGYLGNDFRNAYVPDTTLTGAGQVVGLLQFDGFYASDITAYEAAAGIPAIPLQTVLLDGFNGVPTTGANSGNGEVSLDIELAMAMAPGLAKIVVFEAGPNGFQNDILNAMAANNTIKNLSCSWGWSGGPDTTTDSIFKQMAAQGQSFFNASGDSDAFTTGSSSVNGVDNPSLQNAPSSCPYITQVGGTTLTMNGTGAAYASETVWNWGGGQGSSGGISSSYSIPGWQTGISMAANGGSTSFRNTPDVAMAADNVYVIYGNGSSSSFGGTSCAAPLWAGFMALVNQQLAAQGQAAAGFINPALYALAKGGTYNACFHDTTTGNNFWSSSPSAFSAVTGYDLCTGLGSPAGQSLINALAGGADVLGISPVSGFAATGYAGGPFRPSSLNFALTNAGATALTWSLINTSAWLSASATSGTLTGQAATGVVVSLSAAASTLAAGNYSANLVWSNWTSLAAFPVPFTLQVTQPMSVSPSKGFTAVGAVGGPFTPGSQSFVLTNLGRSPVNWSLINTSAWLNASPASGALAGGGQAMVTVNLSATASTLAAAVYNANVVFTNQAGVVAVVPFSATVGQPIVVNSGFETGDFTGWTLAGNTAYSSVTSGNAAYVHSGTYGAQLGPSGTPAYLSQNLTTVPGQSYLLSLWLRNASGATPNLFQVQWRGATLFNQANLTASAWTNLHWLVTATASTTTLLLGFQDDPDYLGLDDVTVTPVAPVAFRSTLRAASGFQLTWNTTPGLIYQVRYKTNLLQPNWIPLTTNTASAATLTITDTNRADPVRFYRLYLPPQ